MQATEMRRLNETEKTKITQIVVDHGYVLLGGSFELINGKKRYNISIDNFFSDNALKRLGKILVQALDADEIYHTGSRIA